MLGIELPFSTWTLVVMLVILAITWDYWKKTFLPPGPKGLPFIGYLFSFDRPRLHEQWNELHRIYKSDIITVPGISKHLYILNTYDLMKEVFQRRTDVADRMDFNSFGVFEPGYTGILHTSGKMWKEVRRFSISALRDFGMGRTDAEKMIQNESEKLRDVIRSFHGKAFDPQSDLNIAVSNIISAMVFGRTFDRDNEKFMVALQGMNDFFFRINNTTLMLAFMIKPVRIYMKSVREKYEQALEAYTNFSSFVENQIAEHRENYEGEGTDLIYRYLEEMEEERESDIFDEKMLKSLITDFFFAGSETTYTSLRWCLLTMAAFPEVQQKVQEELDQVIGERGVSMTDKRYTPYTEAVLYETQRYFTLTPIGGAHSNTQNDIEVNGYTFPRGSIFMANVHMIHHDEKFWKNPQNFDPENFLENGKVSNLDRFVPFGLGRRACAGEALARMELYLFFTGLVKDFQIKLETDDCVPDLSGTLAAVYTPNPFKIRMNYRH